MSEFNKAAERLNQHFLDNRDLEGSCLYEDFLNVLKSKIDEIPDQIPDGNCELCKRNDQLIPAISRSTEGFLVCGAHFDGDSL